MTEKNVKPKYSEMLMELVAKFDEQMPSAMTFEETLEVGIAAWNFANNKEFLLSHNLYEEELARFEDPTLTEKMIAFKIEKFEESTNIIIDYTTANNILTLKTQTFKNYFNSIIIQSIKSKIDKG